MTNRNRTLTDVNKPRFRKYAECKGHYDTLVLCGITFFSHRECYFLQLASIQAIFRPHHAAVYFCCFSVFYPIFKI